MDNFFNNVTNTNARNWCLMQAIAFYEISMTGCCLPLKNKIVQRLNLNCCSQILTVSAFNSELRRSLIPSATTAPSLSPCCLIVSPVICMTRVFSTTQKNPSQWHQQTKHNIEDIYLWKQKRFCFIQYLFHKLPNIFEGARWLHNTDRFFLYIFHFSGWLVCFSCIIQITISGYPD